MLHRFLGRYFIVDNLVSPSEGFDQRERALPQIDTQSNRQGLASPTPDFRALSLAISHIACERVSSIAFLAAVVGNQPEWQHAVRLSNLGDRYVSSCRP